MSEYPGMYEQDAARIGRVADEAVTLRADLALMTDARDVAVQCARIEADRADAAVRLCDELMAQNTGATTRTLPTPQPTATSVPAITPTFTPTGDITSTGSATCAAGSLPQFISEQMPTIGDTPVTGATTRQYRNTWACDGECGLN